MTVITVRPPDVVWWCVGGGGSRYYRCDEQQRAVGLVRPDLDTMVTAGMCETWSRARVLVAQRIVSEGGWRVLQQLRRLASAGRRPDQLLVFDCDDNYFEPPPSATASAGAFSRADIRRRLEENLRAADLVTVCSRALRQVALEFNSNVLIVPNSLPASLVREPATVWDPTPRCRLDHEGAGRRPLVGWVSSPDAHSDLDPAVPALRGLLGEGLIRLALVGMRRADAEAKGLLGFPGVEVRRWTHGVERYIGGIDFDLWIAPHGACRFNDSRFPTKVMEASTVGIPLLASPVGGYYDAVSDGRAAGAVLVDGGDWDGAIRSLVSDPDRIVDLGRRWDQRLWVTEHRAGALCELYGIGEK